MRKVLASSIVAGLTLLGAAARADVTFCNKSSSQIWVAWADVSFGSNKCHRGDSASMWTRGWWNIQPNTCAKVESGAYCTTWQNLFGNCPAGLMWYHAENEFGATWGSSSDLICTPNTAFDSCPFMDGCPAGAPEIPWGRWNHTHVVDNLTFNFNP